MARTARTAGRGGKGTLHTWVQEKITNSVYSSVQYSIAHVETFLSFGPHVFQRKRKVSHVGVPPSVSEVLDGTIPNVAAAGSFHIV